MKKTLLMMSVILTTAAASVRAQIYIGPKMGSNFSKVPTTEKILPNGNKELIKSGLNIGAAANIGFGKKISLQTELLFTQKGYKDEWRRKSDSILIQESLTANYLELALMPRFTFGKETIKGYLNAGPSFAYWITGKTTVVNSEEDIDETKVDFKNDQDLIYGKKRFEFGINAGTGVLLAAGKGNIVLDFRYTYGITPSRKWVDKENNNCRWNNSLFSVTVGYLFKL